MRSVKKVSSARRAIFGTVALQLQLAVTAALAFVEVLERVSQLTVCTQKS
jgi:hypothetical protein